MDQEVLLSNLLTTDDRDETVSVIDSLLSLTYTNDSSLMSFLHSQVPAQISGYFLSNLQSMPDASSKEQWLKKTREYVTSLEIIHVTLAFLPSRASLERISQVVRKEYEPYILLQVSYNPDLIAGTEIVYKGTYHDLSARGKFEEVITQMKGNLS